MFRIKYVLPLMAALLFAAPAKASSWMACKGTGEVVDSRPQEDGAYALKVRVRDAVVTDGMAAVGDSCVAGILPVIVDVTSARDIKIGETVPLAFRSYSGMGAAGPVSSSVWSLDTEEAEAAKK